MSGISVIPVWPILMFVMVACVLKNIIIIIIVDVQGKESNIIHDKTSVTYLVT